MPLAVICILSGEDKFMWVIILVLVPVSLWLVSVFLWIAVGGIVGPQKSKDVIVHVTDNVTLHAL